MSATTDRVISKSTLLPIGFVLVLLGGALWLNNKLVNLDHSLDLIDLRLKGIEEDLARGIDDRWRGADMKVWAMLLKAENPELVVPDPWSSRGSKIREEDE